VPGAIATEADALVYDQSVRRAGQDCRDALGRVRGWHVANGLML
jgi:hypothetical protein